MIQDLIHFGGLSRYMLTVVTTIVLAISTILTYVMLSVNQVIFRIVEDHPRDVSQDMNISIVFGDESLPRLYENSRISSDQLPAQPGKNILYFFFAELVLKYQFF